MTKETAPTTTRRQALRLLDPFEEMQRHLAYLWNERWPSKGTIFGALKPLVEAHDWAPHLDMYQKSDKLVLEMDLPGLKKTDIDVSLEGDDLVVSGKREQDEEVKAEGYYRMERASGSFYRRVALPFEVELRNVHARFEDGVLHIEILKPLQAPRPVAKVKVD